MEAAAVVISFALFVGALYLIIRPFLVPAEAPVEEAISPELESQKNRIIDAIREIEMDYQTGKLDEEDYTVLKSRYTAAAAEVLKRIDAQAEADADGSGTATPADRAESVSAAAPDPDSSQPRPGEPDEEDDLEALIAARKAQLKEGQDA